MFAFFRWHSFEPKLPPVLVRGKSIFMWKQSVTDVTYVVINRLFRFDDCLSHPTTLKMNSTLLGHVVIFTVLVRMFLEMTKRSRSIWRTF
jgi:hypothetical protein